MDDQTDDQKTPKNPKKYFCEKCDFVSSNKKDYARHITTLKHKKWVKDDQKDDHFTLFSSQKTPKNPKKPQIIYECNCGKIYSYKQGLSKHRYSGKCLYVETYNTYNDVKLNNLVLELLKQNSELIKVLENNSSNINTINSNNINSNNKSFNLQFFLNETCKDAMNITDFVDSIKLQLSDLERVGELGYVKGISDIITHNLLALDVTQRPVHCTDKKREIMYIKDQNIWLKEDENKPNIRKMISKIADKNFRILPQMRIKYPEYEDANSFHSDKYNKTVVEAVGGAGNNNTEKENKIIKNIIKCVTIDK